MPQARAGGSEGRGSRSSSGGTRRSTSSRSTRSTSSRSSSSRAGRAAAAKRSTTRRATTSARARSTGPKPGSPEARIEAAAARVRKLNEQIIEAGKQAGETTLTSYERFLKSIATSLERGPGKSDVEWISNLATAQAKFIREVTSSFTKAARRRLK
jgi:hypothetical protein